MAKVEQLQVRQCQLRLVKRPLKWWPVIPLVAMCSCAHQPPCPIPDTYKSLDEWQVHASGQVRSWVPLGTPAADARHTMEQRGFETITNTPSLLHCYYSSSGSLANPVLERISVRFDLADGKVSAEQVNTGLEGP